MALGLCRTVGFFMSGAVIAISLAALFSNFITMGPYNLTTEFDFGMFQGNTIEDIFRGNKSIEPLKEGLLTELRLLGFTNFEEALLHMTVQGVNLYAIEKSPIRNVALAQLQFAGIPIGMEAYALTLEYNNQKFHPAMLSVGNPDYIQWCLGTVKWFFIDPALIRHLEEMSFVERVRFEAYTLNRNFYFIPKFEESRFTFSSQALQKNKRKFESWLDIMEQR